MEHVFVAAHENVPRIVVAQPNAAANREHEMFIEGQNVYSHSLVCNKWRPSFIPLTQFTAEQSLHIP